MPDVDYRIFAEHSELLALTAEEMQRQLARWKPINGHAHPMLAGADSDLRREFMAVLEQNAKDENDLAVVDGELDWFGILREEFYEAFAEGDAGKAIVELVQVAAVALSAAVSVHRHGLGGKVVPA